MANTQAMTTSFKKEILTAYHNFGTTATRTATTADVFKAALYVTTGALGAATTAYATASEVSGSGYTAGGVVVTNTNAPLSSGTTAYWTPSAGITYSAVTLATAFDSVLIYNNTQGNRAVSVHTFGSQTITAGTFTLLMPTSAAGTALINIA
jgi:hypothetical protein